MWLKDTKVKKIKKNTSFITKAESDDFLCLVIPFISYNSTELSNIVPMDYKITYEIRALLMELLGIAFFGMARFS